MDVRTLFRFPHPVNETSARLVATGVVLLCAVTLVTRDLWLLIPLVYGFWARVLTGPTLSPLGQLVTRGITPRVHATPRMVPGPPKRFAQGIGAVLSTTAGILALAGQPVPALVVVGMILVAASLEAFLAFCLGCEIFKLLMRAKVIPEETCAECANFWSRQSA